MTTCDARTNELAANLGRVRDAIAAATETSGRAPGCVTLIAVTKNWPAEDVRRLAGLGVTDVGENRDQEASLKHAACIDLGLTWHFVGQLQRNKAASVARYADVVHSVDRPALVSALARGALAARRRVGVCLQVDLGNDPASARAGVAPKQLPELANQVVGYPQLELLGLMTVAPLGSAPLPVFQRLAQLSAQMAATHPGATMISAGMSADMPAAIAAGATHVRIGTALLGTRGVTQVT